MSEKSVCLTLSSSTKLKDGREYSGQFLENQMYGDGTYSWPEGKQYVGQYKRDEKDGEGTFTWPDGQSFSGQWRRNKQHGRGVFRDRTGKERLGEWSNGAHALAGRGVVFCDHLFQHVSDRVCVF